MEKRSGTRKKLALHWRIIIGMVLGIILGVVLAGIDGGKDFVIDWVKPWGTIFVNLLKLIAIPLIVASLLKGILDLKDISKFAKIGGRSILMYVGTTIVAITIGLIIVNLVKPGEGISEETIVTMTENYAGDEGVTSKLTTAEEQGASGPLSFIENMVPSNVFEALGDNGNMLQVIFFVIFFGLAMLLVPPEKTTTIKHFFDGLNDVVLKMVDIIMLSAPFAVLALMATVIVSSESWEILEALLYYGLTVIAGLIIMIIFYLVIMWLFTKKNPFWFLKNLAPAQLLAFTTSSSAATLPVTIERVEEHIGVDKEVSSFVLPVGATINMDGTSLYQAVAAVFIAQALMVDLTFMDQLTIIFTALMASIGSAAVPGAGMVMLVIVLQAVGKFTPEQIAIGLTLIFAVDRPLDMLRTTVNVTGDATVSMVVAKSLGKLGDPHPHEVDEYLDNLSHEDDAEERNDE
ncbi:MAG: dicarboxylate/amino acid:cation symporter [Crocinitomicaceae bacterium]|nr:dicarboxylate/amino acid:cation symporter [Crocinitomicaceae bacterium]